MGKKRWPLQRWLTSVVNHVTLVLALLPRVRGMIHSLSISKDTRKMFQIESFGFREGGFMNLTVSEFSIDGPEPYRAGFIVTKTSTESSAQEELEDALEGGTDNGDGISDGCLLHKAGPNDLMLELSERSTWGHRTRASRTIGAGQQGLYVIYFCLCPVAGDKERETELVMTKEGGGSRGGGGEHRVSFKLKVELWNQGEGGARDYLSAGMWALPKLFLGMFGLFFAALLVWVQSLRRYTKHVHHIHHMMTVLLVFKTLSMLFESIRYHYLRLTGAAEAWSIVYYLFAFLKGITLFVVVLLIGTGWSLIKPFLNNRDKQIIVVVLSLQVVNNVAQIVLEETAPGSTVWLKWRNVLHVVDIVCCCSILVPIMWSIRHLRQAALADGKAENTIRRLNVFRHFYKMVLLYVYFTRIVLVLLSAMLPFEMKWLEQLSSELATLVFFVVTGWRFRPQTEAPYLPVAKGGEDEAMLGHYEDGEGVEFQTLRRESAKEGT